MTDPVFIHVPGTSHCHYLIPSRFTQCVLPLKSVSRKSCGLEQATWLASNATVCVTIDFGFLNGHGFNKLAIRGLLACGTVAVHSGIGSFPQSRTNALRPF